MYPSPSKSSAKNRGGRHAKPKKEYSVRQAMVGSAIGLLLAATTIPGHASPDIQDVHRIEQFE